MLRRIRKEIIFIIYQSWSFFILWQSYSNQFAFWWKILNEYEIYDQNQLCLRFIIEIGAKHKLSVQWYLALTN